MKKFLFEHLFSITLGTYPGVEFLGHMVILCLTLGEPPNYFPKQLYHFTFSERYMRVPISLHSHKHLLSSVFFSIAILVDVKWCLIAVLICIYVMTNDDKHRFTAYGICSSFVEKCLFKYFAHFLIELFFFIIKFKSSLYILETNLLSYTWLANIFSHSIDHFLEILSPQQN